MHHWHEHPPPDVMLRALAGWKPRPRSQSPPKNVKEREKEMSRPRKAVPPHKLVGLPPAVREFALQMNQPVKAKK
jgi:hypothetical protein